MGKREQAIGMVTLRWGIDLGGLDLSQLTREQAALLTLAEESLENNPTQKAKPQDLRCNDLRRDPRQISIFGDLHTRELQQQKR